jgi:hypothetical protein
MAELTIKGMCACGFAKEWELAVLSDPFLEEMDAQFSLGMLKEAIKRKAEPHGPFYCPKCQLMSVYFYFVGHWN